MILDDIVLKRKERYKSIMENKPLEEIKKEALLNTTDSLSIIYDKLENGFLKICECKKASPSKGIISENYDYLSQAKSYEENGADIISCLTEPDYFLGSDKHLIDIKNNINIPVLRKDFIFDEYQIYEAKAIKADMILLICAILDYEKLKYFLDLAHSLNLACLVETHNEDEIKMAIRSGAKIIGVNNRNLYDFTVDNNLSINLKNKFKDVYLISESGIKSPNDVKMIKKSGLNGVLIGEALMRSNDIKKTFKEFFYEG